MVMPSEPMSDKPDGNAAASPRPPKEVIAAMEVHAPSQRNR